MNDFQSRFREALRRRIFPNAPLHLKQVAGAIGRSKNTISRWSRGETHVAADDLCSIAEFLARRGDKGFLCEIFGDLLPAETTSGAAAQTALAMIRTMLAESAGTVGAARDSLSWFAADGAIHPAATGHSDFIRRTLRIADAAGDLATYAMRVLGWVALTERGDGVLVIRHDGRRVAALAAERICEWLENRADAVPQVRRSVHMDGRWIDAHHTGGHAAAAAIAKVAFIVRLPRPPWAVQPLALGAVSNPRLTALLEVFHREPDHLVHAAADMGAFTTSNLFGVYGDDVVSHHVATSFAPGLDPRAIVGFNVLSRADTDYGVMLQSRILRTRRDGPNYNELTGMIDDNFVRYLNLALPERGPEGRVLTSTVILELDRVAA